MLNDKKFGVKDARKDWGVAGMKGVRNVKFKQSHEVCAVGK